MSAHQAEARNFARAIAMQAIWPFAFALMLSVYLSPVPPLFDWPVGVIFIGAIAAGCAALCLSVYLLFDAALFLMMSRYPDEDSGGAAVDALLARMRLRSVPKRTRTLAERVEGTGFLLSLQRTALAAAIVSTVAALFVTGTQAP